MANVLIKLFLLGTLVVTGTTLSHFTSTTNNNSNVEDVVVVSTSTTTTNRSSSHHHHSVHPKSHNKHHQQHQRGHHSNYTWSEWSEWSSCSRPCDGGISISLRKCLSRSVCIGDAHRYRICNMHACSIPTDYRAIQCAAFNSRAFRDRFYEWEPYIDPVDSCSLTCKAHGVSFVAKLAPIVKDGTRCSDSSLDMCVAGKCLSVGCDLQLGSLARIDECGICGGDGSSCSSSSHSHTSSSSSSLFSWTHRFVEPCSSTCGGGEQHSEVVCANTESGAFVNPAKCHSFDKPAPTRRPCNTHNCPPTWRISEWSNCSRKCGGGHRTRRVDCHRQVNGSHRILSEYSCSGTEKPVSEERCNTDDCPQWFAGDWQRCSNTCGSGEQKREVNCRDAAGAFSSYCEEELKPSMRRECSDMSDCPSDEEAEQEIGFAAEPSFLIGDWSPCNVSCGDGFQTRQVNCRIYLSFSRNYRQLPDSQCTTTAPKRHQKCHVECPYVPEDAENEIDYEPERLEKSLASMMKKTFDTEEITTGNDPNGARYHWEASGFTECSQLCLGGVQETRFICLLSSNNATVDGSFCDIEEKPDSYTRTCNDHPCPPKWNIGEWSGCTKQCGRGGVRTRHVRCVHEVARGNGNVIQVDDTKCQESKPATKEPCNQVDCSARWIASAWSKCSKECGRGIKTRKIRCMRETSFEGIKEASPRDCPVRKPRVFKTCNLKSCKFGENVIHTFQLSDSEATRKAKRNNNALWVNKYTQEKVIVKVEGKAIVYEGSLVKLRCPDWREPMDYDLKFDTKLRWAKNNVPIDADASRYLIRNVLKIKSVKLSDTGVYKCTLEDGTVHSMFLHVIPKPHNEPPVAINDDLATGKLLDLDKSQEEFSKKFELDSPQDLELAASDRKLTLDEGNFKNLDFNWIMTSWSDCTVKCGGIGFRMRLAQCYVRFENITEKVQNTFCTDAGLKQPKNIETCGFTPCAHWQTSAWSECSDCRSLNRGRQTRTVSCVSGNRNVEPDNKCREIVKPEEEQDCYNSKCVAEWRTGSWSECNSYGERSRSVTCVWRATGKPITISESAKNQNNEEVRARRDAPTVAEVAEVAEVAASSPTDGVSESGNEQDSAMADESSKSVSDHYECNRYDTPTVIERCIPSKNVNDKQRRKEKKKKKKNTTTTITTNTNRHALEDVIDGEDVRQDDEEDAATEVTNSTDNDGQVDDGDAFLDSTSA